MALTKVRKYYDYFKQLLNDWRTRPEPEEPKTLGEAISTVHAILLDNPMGLTWERFRKRITWKRYDLSEVLSALFDQRRVFFAKGHSTSKGGRPPLLLFAKEFKQNADKYEHYENWRSVAIKTGIER